MRLEQIGRCHNSRASLRALEILGRSPVRLSIDILAGLPGQKPDDLTGEIETCLDYKPEHVSVYELQVNKTNKLHKLLPAENQILENLNESKKFLEQSGFVHYEISNYCLPHKESLHNLKYWTRTPYIGVGPSASSFVSEKWGKRWKNPSDIRKYIRNPHKKETEVITRDLALMEYVSTGLRLGQGINRHNFKKLFNRKSV